MLNILPLTYLGNLQYFVKLCFEECVIDIHENYVRQSYRNRCDIMAANGAVSLTVNVSGGRSMDKKAVRDMRIDYSKDWQHRHWQTLVSAYRNSPYFDFYTELFEAFYRREYEFLFDFNLGLTEAALSALGMDVRLQFSERYIDPAECTAPDGAAVMADMRPVLAPRSAPSLPDPSFRTAPYWQVFSDRMPFAPNLSIVDLIFCEGPGAAEILRSCRLPVAGEAGVAGFP